MRPYLAMLNKERIEHTLVTRSLLFFLVCSTLLFISLISSTGLQGDVFISMEFHGDFSPTSIDASDDIKAVLYLLYGGLSLLLSGLYFAKTMRKERQEGSTMFWRSMPISPLQFHGVKLFYGLVIIPMMCGALLLLANLYLYAISVSSENPLALLLQYDSLGYALLSGIEFAFKMLLGVISVFTLASILMALSQLTNSPILVFVFSTYVAQFFASLLLGFDGLANYFTTLYKMPFLILFNPNPWSPISDAGVVFWLVSILVGLLAFAISLSLSRTTEVSWRSFKPSNLLK